MTSQAVKYLMDWASTQSKELQNDFVHYYKHHKSEYEYEGVIRGGGMMNLLDDFLQQS